MFHTNSVNAERANSISNARAGAGAHQCGIINYLAGPNISFRIVLAMSHDSLECFGWVCVCACH